MASCLLENGQNMVQLFLDSGFLVGADLPFQLALFRNDVGHQPAVDHPNVDGGHWVCVAELQFRQGVGRNGNGVDAVFRVESRMGRFSVDGQPEMDASRSADSRRPHFFGQV